MGPPLQAAGYQAGGQRFEGDRPTYIVVCDNDYKCPGSTALNSCPQNREGVACDLCAVNFVDEGNKCAECGKKLTATPLILTLIAAFAIAFGLYGYSAQEVCVQSETFLTVALTFALLVNSLQVLGAFRELNLDWPEPLKSIYWILSIFTFNVEFLNPGCVFNVNRPELTYLGSLLTHPCFAVLLGLVFLIARSAPPPVGRKVEMTKVLNAQGLVLMVFYISLSVVTMVPWQCELNPDDSYSVASKRSVLCWESDTHGTLIALSVLGILVYDVGFLSLVAWATFKYPSQIVCEGGIHFVTQFHFLFNRFTADRYFYGFFYCIRNLGITLVPAIFASETEVQFLLMLLIITFVLAVQCRLWPWRVPKVNLLDAAASLALAMIVGGGTMLVDIDSGHGENVVQGFFIVVLCIFVVVLLGFLILSGCLLVFPRKPFGVFLCHHKDGAAVFARWVKLMLNDLTSEKVFLDSDMLDRLDQIFQTVGYETKNFVPLLTKETLRRIWCAGEIASAMRGGPTVVAVACEDYEAPSDAFIDSIGLLWSDNQKTEVLRLGVEMQAIKAAYMSFESFPSRIWTASRPLSGRKMGKIRLVKCSASVRGSRVP
jgi:hypothetical protein